MPKIAIIGDRDSIIGFKALGVKIFSVGNKDEAERTLRQISTPDYGAVFITENYAVKIQKEIDELKRQIPLYPSIVIIPSHHGTMGLGAQRIKVLIEKALGWSFFTQPEEEDKG